MAARFRFWSSGVPLLLVVALLAACSDDESPAGGGEVDTAPPAVSSATAIDSIHVEVAFGEELDRASAEYLSNYSIVEGTTAAGAGARPVVPGDPLPISAIVLKSDQRTVSFSTSAMDTLQYDLTISGVKDANGNAVQTPIVSAFTGTSDADVTAPEIAYRSPRPNTHNVPTGASLFVAFSEQVDFPSGGTTWSSSSGDVYYGISSDDGAHFVLTPYSPLDIGTEYTITIPAIQDYSGNTMPGTSWSFTTTSTPDQTPPTVESSNPADLATLVPLDTDIVITFSEPMRQDPLNDIELFPYVDGDFEWLDARSLRFNAYAQLVADQQYALTIFPHTLRDLAYNALVPVTIRFTTGDAIARGSIAGTLKGDSESAYANDPTGAFVFVATSNFETVGSAIVATNNSYSIQNLPDGFYIVVAIMDSNGNDVLDVDLGDAFGILGINPRTGDYDEDVVTIMRGNRVANANFALFDSSVISGTVWYDGFYYDEFHEIGIGLFDTHGFNPLSDPEYSFSAQWPYSPEFWFDSFDNGPSDGTFYIGAFLDANDNFTYDPGEDPAVFYDEPSMAIAVGNGSDFNFIIYVQDPVPGSPAASVAWPLVKTSKRGEWLKQVSAIVRNSGRERKR